MKSRLRSIVENLDASLSHVRTPEQPETKPAAKVDEVPAPIQEAGRELKSLDEGFALVGRKMAQFVFGKDLERMPSRVLALESSKTTLAEEIAPYMESFQRLTKPLYEAQQPTIYREDVESAALLFVVSEMTGRSYDQVLTLDAPAQRTLVENELTQVVRQPAVLDEFVRRVVPVLARGAAAAGRGVLKAGWAGKEILKGATNIAARLIGSRVADAVRPKEEARDPSAKSLTEDFVAKTRKLLKK